MLQSKGVFLANCFHDVRNEACCLFFPLSLLIWDEIGLVFYLVKYFIRLLQILKDEATREQYDYAIAHPEEVEDRLCL